MKWRLFYDYVVHLTLTNKIISQLRLITSMNCILKKNDKLVDLQSIKTSRNTERVCTIKSLI